MDVIFALQVLLYDSRSSCKYARSIPDPDEGLFGGRRAIPALFTNTLYNDVSNCGSYGRCEEKDEPSSRPYFFSIYSFVLKMVVLDVASNSTTSRLAVT